ncbi:MAG: hypothetical protein HY343_12210 [Lentisphaerae bacterium]|nr:hypothetical protein [Lentisphaerota bacterium]
MNAGLSRQERVRLVLAAADFLIKHQTADGDFRPPDSRAGYNETYDAKGMFTVLQAAYLTDTDRRQGYLSSLTRRLRRFERVQKPDGALPLYAGKEEVIGITVGAVPAIAWLYRELSGDDSFDAMSRRALDYLAGTFNDRTGFKDPVHNPKILTYNDDFPLYACHLWSARQPALKDLVVQATRYITEGPLWNAEGRFFRCGIGSRPTGGVNLADYAHPTLDLDRAWVLFELYGLRFADQIHASIDHIVRHRDLLEDYYTQDGVHMADCRIRMALVGLMATYDRYTRATAFTSTPLYQDWLKWTLAMFDSATGGFHERVPANTGKPECMGVPGQYLAQYALTAGLLNREL